MLTGDPDVPAGGNTIPPLKKVSPAKNWCFTYHLKNGSSGDPEYLTLLEKFEKHKVKYLFSFELGSEGKTPHFQGYIQFEKKSRWSTLDLIKEIHWEVARGKLEDQFNYILKEGNQFWTNIDRPQKKTTPSRNA